MFDGDLVWLAAQVACGRRPIDDPFMVTVSGAVKYGGEVYVDLTLKNDATGEERDLRVLAIEWREAYLLPCSR